MTTPKGQEVGKPVSAEQQARANGRRAKRREREAKKRAARQLEARAARWVEELLRDGGS